MDYEYWKKVGKGLAIALVGASLAYVSSTVIPALKDSPNTTLLIVVPILSALVNAVQKMILDPK